MLLVPDAGELILLGYIRATINANNVFLALFQNDKTPANGDVLADYTVCDFDGYATKSLNNFSIPITVAGRAYIAEALQVFLATGGVTPNDVYGYYVIDAGGTTVLWAERFPGAPISINAAGQTVPVTPSFTLRSEPP